MLGPTCFHIPRRQYEEFSLAGRRDFENLKDYQNYPPCIMDAKEDLDVSEIDVEGAVAARRYVCPRCEEEMCMILTKWIDQEF